MASRGQAKTILIAGIVAASLDILAAILMYYFNTGKPPTRMLQYIASAIFGKEAFQGGISMAMWGLVFHYIIATGFAFLYFFIYPHVKLLWKNRLLSGMLYGLSVWAIMNLVVVPTSNAPVIPFRPLSALINMIILILFVGLPIAIIVHHHYRGKIVSEES